MSATEPAASFVGGIRQHMREGLAQTIQRQLSHPLLDFTQTAIGSINAIVDNFRMVLDTDLLERAFDGPGEPGDAIGSCGMPMLLCAVARFSHVIILKADRLLPKLQLLVA